MKRTQFFCFLCLCLLLAYVPAAVVRAEDLSCDGDTVPDVIDRMVFLGESTTAHLRTRGDVCAKQIWANDSGTMKLDSALLSRTVNDPETGLPVRIPEAIAKYRPQILVLSFGLNGITEWAKEPERYLANYRKLTDRVFAESPETQIIIQSVYPVACDRGQSDWRFSASPEEINREILRLNGMLAEFCGHDPRIRFADTASVLYDEAGYLREDFTTDGIHLTASAYREILSTLRKQVQTE